MIKKKVCTLRLTYIYIFVAFCVFYGCASIQQPQGGPRDTEPPKVLEMIPENKTVNFNSEKIIIEFDEYFKIENEFKEFSVSPELAQRPTLKKKGKRLEITFADTLEKNTTYTLNFGKSIVDVNENNPLKNFTYVFATGAKIDSLHISGKVTNALTGQPELDAVVFILPLIKDTIFGKARPSIYTTTDSSGNYILNNLRKDVYKIYALKEKNGDKIYQQSTDEIGFIKDSISLTQNIDSINISVFKERAPEFRIIEKRLGNDGMISLIFNQQLKKPEVTIIDPQDLDKTKLLQFNTKRDSLKLWLTDLGFDSTKIAIKDDGNLLQTTTITRGKKETYSRNLTISDNLQASSLNPYKPLKIYINMPAEAVDNEQIELLEDSIPVSGFALQRDTANILSYTLKYPWKPKKTYTLNLNPGTFKGIFETTNKSYAKNFSLANKDNYGTLKVKIVTPEQSQSYIIEVVNENKAVVNSIVVTKDTVVSFSNYTAGKYFIRIIYDTNKNEIWDTGNVKQGTQPEKIWYETKELSIRPLWERNETITIPPDL